VSQSEAGLRRLFRQFSFPGGIPSHVAPQTPGSIHEGGELGYSLAHAFGAAFDNPDLLVCCVVGDGEAETGPLAASWHSNKFLDAARDGAVLPVLHLNGYKIANPTILARIPEHELRSLLEGYGYAPRFVSGDDPEAMHQLMAATLDDIADEIAEIQRAAREHGKSERPRWPMIVLRTPKGWTGPKIVDGLPLRGNLPLAPGAAGEPAEQPRAPRAARAVAALLPPGRALRRGWRAARRARGACPASRAAHGGDPGGQRRPADARPRAAGLPRLRRRRRRARDDDERLRHRAYTRAIGDDPATIRDWVWPAQTGS